MKHQLRRPALVTGADEAHCNAAVGQFGWKEFATDIHEQIIV